MKHIVIIGNGISGITAARNIRKRSNYRITVISSETKYFYSRTALMYIYMGHMKFEHTKPYEDNFWRKNKIELNFDHVEKVEVQSRRLMLKSGNTITFDQLIIAAGSISNKFGWPGQNLLGVQGLYSFQDLELMEQHTKGVKHAVVVGGGLIGVEMAEMLLSRDINITFLVREKEFWNNVLPLQEANLISREVRSHHIDLKLETELREIKGDENGRVNRVITSNGETIKCQFVGLTAGVTPNIHFLADSGIKLNKGVLVNEFLETNVPDIFAIGDCVERTYDLTGRKNIEQVWYTGRMMGEVVAQTICGEKTRYEPGPWFNSAKFFDIEYQTYGQVGNELNLEEADYYWEHPEGKKAIHLVWSKHSRLFKGINSFGIRLRHECFDRWLREGRSINYVLSNLAEANFDPEFFARNEPAIISALSTAYPELKIEINA
jgi:NAD(P)H-nitrite reductase large subunit